MVPANLEAIFRTDDARRDNFRARLFAMFSEDIVRIWASDERAPYRDLGRPTLWLPGDKRGSTIDFAFVRRADGRVFVAELKAELAFDNYRYLRLERPDQLDHHGYVSAFTRFLALAAAPTTFEVRVAAKPLRVDGAILVWGAVSQAGRAAVIERHGFADVLSVEAMIDDLRRWANPDWEARLVELRAWVTGLLDALGLE